MIKKLYKKITGPLFATRPMPLQVQSGQPAPGFTLPDQHGNMHSLSDYAGKWVLVYFYPEDDTPGCTIEACNLRDASPMLGELNAQVIGISADSVNSHKAFVDKYQLNFILLADEDHKVSSAYGTWGKKSIFGNVTEGVRRVSILIDPVGNIVKIYPRVDPIVHADEVVADLQQLQK